MKTRLTIPVVITVFLFITLSALPVSIAEDYSTSYQLLDEPGGKVVYTINIVVPQSLLEYYEGKSDKLPSTSAFSSFVTPYALKPIADTLQTIYKNEEDFTNAVLMIVHQMNYVKIAPGKYPAETLVNDTGDCDIFSFVAASILKAGGLDVVLLYYEDEKHMNVGVHLDNTPENARGSVYSVKRDGITYYMAEATGGNLTYGWRVGESPDNLKKAKIQVLTLENAEEIAPGQVSASFIALESSDISLEISPAIALEDSVITFRGQLSPTIPYQNVTIYLGISGSPWKVLATTATQPDGSFSYTWQTTFEGVYAVRASWNGDETYAGSVSATQNGTVIPMFLTALIGLAILATVVGVAAVLFSRHLRHENLEPQ
ncbi:MAG TPA: Ig-like domain-containing protein, partial [Candidatus Bathyarchaeia archaeon]|nr:Ig-like domain-containing protein [Candidatus Bathyarchaeia archaeon]